MSSSKGFGIQTSSTRKAQPLQWENAPTIEPAEQIALWEAGLLYLRLPPSLQPRPLTRAEQDWLDRAIKAEYLSSDQSTALFYTAPPPDFRLEAADWYLHPNEYWNRVPALLSWAMQEFPSECFQMSMTGEAPGFYPDRTPEYSMQQEQVMRQIFRETVRLGWTLLDYKWFVMQQLHKTTAQVTQADADVLLQSIQELE